MKVMKSASALAMLSILFGAWGCASELPRYNPLQISNTGLTDAKLGLIYDGALIADGGQKPITWSLDAKPASLAWLTLDSASGKLSGVPTAKVSPGELFIIRAVDARGERAEKKLTLQVLECLGSEQTTCYRFDATAQQCQQSSVLCSNGRFPDCGAGPVSNDLNHCGPPASGTGCGSCGTSGDSCDGLCKCGVGPACNGTTPDCCGGSCANLQTDPLNCGVCGNVCPTTTLPLMEPVCTASVCGVACITGYIKCSAGCVNANNDENNCGGCGVQCRADQICDGGNCDCRPGAIDCAGTCVPPKSCTSPIP